MAEDIAQHLQAAILKGYSQKFKDEFLNPKNIGKLEHSDSHVRITGPCGDTVEMWLAGMNLISLFFSSSTAHHILTVAPQGPVILTWLSECSSFPMFFGFKNSSLNFCEYPFNIAAWRCCAISSAIFVSPRRDWLAYFIKNHVRFLSVHLRQWSQIF